MLDIHGIEANRRALLADLKQLIEEALQPFADDLREFLERVRAGQFEHDWRSKPKRKPDSISKPIASLGSCG